MISETRIKHSLGVARCCEVVATDMGLSEEEQLACFVMGLLHDIGYESAIEKSEHPIEGGKYLKAFNKHFRACCSAIETHGKVKPTYSVFDNVLNKADLSVNPSGYLVGFNERLDDIKYRYGSDSRQYNNAVSIVEHLRRIESDTE